MRTRRKQKAAATTRRLPPALAARAEKLVAAKAARIADEARDDIALIKQKWDVVQAAFYEIGQALVRLSRPAVAPALGYRSFEQLVRGELGMALSTATRFRDMAERLHEADAIRWGSQKSQGVVELLDAAGARKLLPGGRLALRDGEMVDVENAGAEEIARIAKRLRHARQRRGKPRGRTTTRAERALVAKLARIAKARKLAGSFECLATKPGAPADIRIRVPLAQLDELRRVLAELS